MTAEPRSPAGTTATPPIAIVTGASRGIGSAVARGLAGQGATVVLAARSAPDLHVVRREIEQLGGRALDLPMDVTDDDAVKALVDTTLGTFGRLDVAVNAAAAHGGRPTPTAELDVDRFDATMAVTLRGVFLCLTREIAAMRSAGAGGSIVNVASTTAVHPVAGLADYVAAKHAVLGLTKVAALDHAADGIRVNAVLPGPTHTEGLERAGAAARAAVAARIPMRHLATPAEIADLVCWLAGPSAAYVTGSAFAVDGGLLAGEPPFAPATPSNQHGATT